MFVDRDRLSPLQLPTTDTSTRAIRAIAAADFPCLRGLRAGEYNLALRECMRVFDSPRAPRGKQDLQICRDRAAVFDIGVDKISLFRECKKFRAGALRRDLYHTFQVFGVGNITGDVPPEKPLHARRVCDRAEIIVGIAFVGVEISVVRVLDVFAQTFHAQRVAFLITRRGFRACDDGGE